jgi:hypothetical protein
VSETDPLNWNFEDEFGQYLAEAMKDPAFRAEYNAVRLHPGWRERSGWWLGRLDHWAGYNSDPEVFTSPTAWLSLHWIQLWAWRGDAHSHPHLGNCVLVTLRLPFRIRIEVVALWR